MWQSTTRSEFGWASCTEMKRASRPQIDRVASNMPRRHGLPDRSRVQPWYGLLCGRGVPSSNPPHHQRSSASSDQLVLAQNRGTHHRARGQASDGQGSHLCGNGGSTNMCKGTGPGAPKRRVPPRHCAARVAARNHIRPPPRPPKGRAAEPTAPTTHARRHVRSPATPLPCRPTEGAARLVALSSSCAIAAWHGRSTRLQTRPGS